MTVCAALALALALPAGVFAAEPKGTLKLSCKEGKLLSLEARAALAPDVFRALEKECGLQLKGGWNIPDEPVTATYEKVTLEEIIESLIRLAGLPSTLLAIASSGALKLAVLAKGTPAPPAPQAKKEKASEPEALRALFEEEAVHAALEASWQQFLLAKANEERQRALEKLKQLAPEQAEALQTLDPEALAAEQEHAALEVAWQQFLIAKTNEERQRALEELKQLAPEVAEALQSLDPEALAAEQEHAAQEAALRRFLLSQTEQEERQAYEELKRLAPEEVEAVLLNLGSSSAHEPETYSPPNFRLRLKRPDFPSKFLPLLGR